MCTVSILPFPALCELPSPGADEPWLVRVVCNRDERPTRTPAIPPSQRLVETRRCLFPVDPVSQGTWLAVNDAGLLVTLLNASDSLALPGEESRRSRGEVIPAVLTAVTLESAVAAAHALTPSHYLPFRLVIVAAGEVHVLKSNGKEWTESVRTPLIGPLMFASSGLGDALVTAPRAELFAQVFAEPPAAANDWPKRQDAFHRHSWPDRRHLSVLMSRDSARTVSVTTVEIGRRQATMEYQPISDGALAPSQRRSLPLAYKEEP